MTKSDVEFMKRAVELAARGAGQVSPNPMVGAVIVKDGKVVGEGYHRFDLLRHAESYAIEEAGNRGRGATLYCNLEPCCHQGRTPPCTDALIQAGVSRAVIAIADPDPRVNGRGIEQLRSAGVGIDLGACEKEARRLNESYLKFISTGRPFIHAVIVCDNHTAAGAHLPEPKSHGCEVVDEWGPSSDLQTVASMYDGLVLGGLATVNAVFLQTFLAARRHRAPVVLGTSQQIEQAMRLIDAEEAPDARLLRIGVGSDYTLADLSHDLASSSAASAFVLPFPVGDSQIREHADKLTLVRGNQSKQPAEPNAGASFSAELEELQISQVSGFVEITGYPRKK
jgi:riboflavin biosynthesis protein RibD